MDYIFYTFVFILGLIVGSFLNAVIYRLYSKESISKGRSHCTTCGKVLHSYELIPVLSFIIQKRKCRGCGELISFQYPVVELATGVMFLGIFLMSNAQLQDSFQILGALEMIFLWFVVSGLIVIFVYDLKHFLIPDKILFPLIGAVFVYRLFETLYISDLIQISKLEIQNYFPLGIAIISGAGASLFFFLLFYFSQGKAMGFGDVKLAFFIGLLLGFPATLIALFIAFLTGAIIGVGLMAAKKKTMQSKLPFAPFLIFGTVTALFWGNDIMNWYLSLFL